MNKTFFILLLALAALVALTEARPIIYFARQTDSSVNGTNNWFGNVIAYTTITKGRNNHRLRIYGSHNINDTVTGAWLTYTNGTKILEVGISESNDASDGRYIVGDLRINITVFDHLVGDTLHITIYSEDFEDGAISGVFRARPNTGISQLRGENMVPPVTSEAVGFAYSFIENPDLAVLPLDLIARTNLLLNNATYDAQIIHNATNATGADFHAPSNDTSTAPLLAAIPNAATEGAAAVRRFTPVTDAFYAQQLGLAYIKLKTVAHPNGELRGTIRPTLGRTRRAGPRVIDTISGTTTVPASGLRTLRFANQEGNERNANSFISLQTTADGSGNFTYQGFFDFKAAASRRNYNNIRGISLELNVRQFGDAVWSFDVFDSSTGAHVPLATYSTLGQWTPGFSDYFKSDVHLFNNNRRQLFLRVSTNSATTSTLWVDLFAVRSYEPTSETNNAVRSFILFTQLLPFVYGSDS